MFTVNASGVKMEVNILEYDNIGDARNELGITQAQMAEELGVTRQTYAKMEQDPDSMTIRQARTVCSILGRRIGDFYFGKMVSNN